MTIRRRILLVSVLTLAVALGALLTGGNLLLAQTVDGQTRRILRTRIEAQLAALDITPTKLHVRRVINDPAIDAYAWIFSHGKIVEQPEGEAPALNAAAVALGRREVNAQVGAPGDVELRSRVLTLAGRTSPVGVVVVGESTEPLQQLERNVLIGSLTLAGVILLGAALALQRALSGALRPVRRMTQDAEEWGAHDLDRRFDLGPARDEITGLAATLNNLLGRIAASRRHEQRFAAELAHELRTPLAAIRGQAELALNERDVSGHRSPSSPAMDGPADERRSLSAIRDQAERMGETIETLLAFARREAEPSRGGVDLKALVLTLDEVPIEAPAVLPRVEGDAAVVGRALAPLVENALRHARSRAWIEIVPRLRTVQLIVHDDGPGLDPSLGEAAFEPGVRGGAGEPDGGAGLGLPLARRLAASCGGTVTAQPGPGGHFVLELPVVSET